MAEFEPKTYTDQQRNLLWNEVHAAGLFRPQEYIVWSATADIQDILCSAILLPTEDRHVRELRVQAYEEPCFNLEGRLVTMRSQMEHLNDLQQFAVDGLLRAMIGERIAYDAQQWLDRLEKGHRLNASRVKRFTHFLFKKLS